MKWKTEKRKRYYFAFKKEDLDEVRDFFKKSNAVYRLDSDKLLKIISQNKPKYDEKEKN